MFFDSLCTRIWESSTGENGIRSLQSRTLYKSKRFILWYGKVFPKVVAIRFMKAQHEPVSVWNINNDQTRKLCESYTGLTFSSIRTKGSQSQGNSYSWADKVNLQTPSSPQVKTRGDDECQEGHLQVWFKPAPEGVAVVSPWPRSGNDRSGETGSHISKTRLHSSASAINPKG